MGLTVALLLAEILNVVQVFSPAQAVTVCYCCYCCSVVSKQKMPKNPGKTRKYLGFSRYFRVLPALDAGDRRGSLPGLPYCCSAGLTLATVVGEPHCCSVVTVNTSNTVQLLTLGNPSDRLIAPAGHHCCNVRSGHLNATFGGKDMGSMAQTGLLLVPSDALGHTWALPGVLLE